jgi:hypothetical protein
MRARLSVMLFAALVTAMTSLLSPVALAQEQQQQQRDPNEGQPKHEINELQNRLHQTEDKSKENHLENRIDALQDNLQGVQAGANAGRCITDDGGRECWSSEKVENLRKTCLPLAIFTLGFALLSRTCEKVLL